MHKFLLTTALSAALLGGTSFAALAEMTSQEFVTKASSASMFEIETSRLALERAEDPRIKTFAQQMITDHVAAGEGLKTALSHSPNAGTPVKALDEGQTTALKGLQGATGLEFDTLYIAAQTQAHQDAVKLFTEYSDSGTDPALKEFAKTTLPTLHAHTDAVDLLDHEKESPHN